MHPSLLMAFVREMPRLRAQESLRRVTEFAVGSGAMEKRDRERVVREWQAEAGGGAAPARRQTLTQGLGSLAALGIPVRVVEASGD